MSATCIISNCRRLAPPGEPFCSLHRGETVVAFDPKPLTAGIHQRADDSYFRVTHHDAEPGIAPGWYWFGVDRYGVWDEEWIDGPYSTAAAAAQAGWSETTLETKGGAA